MPQKSIYKKFMNKKKENKLDSRLMTSEVGDNTKNYPIRRIISQIRLSLGNGQVQSVQDDGRTWDGTHD